MFALEVQVGVVERAGFELLFLLCMMQSMLARWATMEEGEEVNL